MPYYAVTYNRKEKGRIYSRIAYPRTFRTKEEANKLVEKLKKDPSYINPRIQKIV